MIGKARKSAPKPFTFGIWIHLCCHTHVAKQSLHCVEAESFLRRPYTAGSQEELGVPEKQVWGYSQISAKQRRI